ncbi:hypothetical protein B0T14DRAFT_541014 [Immersiella caudata]|uniref:Ubiquitin-like domain-containing protein n=1 Tax=Immersiella caudata TaxID=314043 RepID=A0AA39TG39_9PEZI|nr:hypothetical protein B0T14DRAFT_541014 [Immersiella caudata]
MELALTFGAVGDFLSIASLIKDIVSALDDSRGSAKAYRGLIDEITHLHKALEQVDDIYRGPDIPTGLSDLVSIAQTSISRVRDTLTAFYARICKKYDDSLSEGGSGNIFKDAARKIQFKLEEKDVIGFRAEVAGHRMSLELFLQVITVRLEQENHKASRLGFLGRRLLSKLDFVARLGIDMKESVSHLSIIRSVVLRLDRGVNNGEHFVLEDPTGRLFPIYMKTITSWEAFNFILEDRFKGKKGERRTRRKLYSLYESASHLEIDYLICKALAAPTADDGDTGLSSCPWYKTVSPGKLGDRVQCSTCKRDFLRIVIEVEDSGDPLIPPSAPVPQSIVDVQFGKPSLGTGKRAREDDDDEACNECRRPKRSKTTQSEDRKRKRSREPDSESESDEENLAGLAHVTLQTKRMRLTLRFTGDAGNPRVTDVPSDDESDENESLPPDGAQKQDEESPGSKELPATDAEKTGPDRPAMYQPRKATELDRKRHGIPAGYSLKNWDPKEDPIVLFGSVFDANSLGKWIYDWTVYHYGPATPISDMAGHLWLLLIKLAGKIKRAEDIVPRIRMKDNREMIEEFIEAGGRLMGKLRELLKACQLRVEPAKEKGEVLGKGVVIEFIQSLFGKDKEIEKTERFMASARLWNLRFDTNCEDILRKPTIP